MVNEQILNYLIKSDNKLARVISHIGPLDFHLYNEAYDSYEFLIREIVGQMISANVKKIIYQRLIDLCGGTICSSVICSLSIEDLRGIGLSYSKCRYIKKISELVENQEVDFQILQNLCDEDVIKELKKIDGIGNWTSKMYLIFFLQREDVLPYEDGAFLQSYKWLYNTNNIKRAEIETNCKKWKPYSSIAARYLYRALDTGLTKIPIDEFLNC